MQMLREKGELKYCFREKLYTSVAMCTLTYILTDVYVFSFFLYLCVGTVLLFTRMRTKLCGLHSVR